MHEEALKRKLAAIEALFAGATTDGERVAAGNVRAHIRALLEEKTALEQPVPFQYAIPDHWGVRLFIALARRYGLEPYRLHRQRRTTVMLTMPPSFANETFWPEFQELYKTLRVYLDDVTERVIREAVHPDASDARETPAGLLREGGGG